MKKTVEIMFDDLIEAKQKELLETMGMKGPEETNWDVFPLALVEMETESEETLNVE